MEAAAPLRSPRPSIHAPGGPPVVRLAGKDKGAITRTEWAGITTPEIGGCVPGTTVVEITVCVKDRNRDEKCSSCKGDKFLASMKQLVAQLPEGGVFTVQVSVIDKAKKQWVVPIGAFT
ncbi:MAG TPA: hypothetical protein VHL57_01285, partial [Flavobacteriales bacterium]|nr:hypothetical protein [Flavobacteriales bacterium]